MLIQCNQGRNIRMEKVKIGYDDNLGLPQDFAAYMGCEIVSYHDLNQLLQAFNQKQLDAIFVPCGTLLALKKADYKIISQSILAFTNGLHLITEFVTTKAITLDKIMQFVIGRVNEYCTTSFWGPLIYLMQVLPQGTELQFENTNGFQDLLDKTAADKVDCSMVWKMILRRNPSDAAKVHELFEKDDLPTPVILANNEFPQGLIDKLNQFKSTDKMAYFNGFHVPDLDNIQRFIKNMEAAKGYFKIKLVG
jgi:hypothetical protein